MKNLEQQIADAQAKLAALKAAASKKNRTDDTRRKILLGAAMMAMIDAGKWPQEQMLAIMDNALTKPADRELFGLPPRQQNEAAHPV